MSGENDDTNERELKRRQTLYYDSSFIKQIKYKRSSVACCPRYSRNISPGYK